MNDIDYPATGYGRIAYIAGYEDSLTGDAILSGRNRPRIERRLPTACPQMSPPVGLCSVVNGKANIRMILYGLSDVAAGGYYRSVSGVIPHNRHKVTGW